MGTTSNIHSEINNPAGGFGLGSNLPFKTFSVGLNSNKHSEKNNLPFKKTFSVGPNSNKHAEKNNPDGGLGLRSKLPFKTFSVGSMSNIPSEKNNPDGELGLGSRLSFKALSMGHMNDIHSEKNNPDGWTGQGSRQSLKKFSVGPMEYVSHKNGPQAYYNSLSLLPRETSLISKLKQTTQLVKVGKFLGRKNFVGKDSRSAPPKFARIKPKNAATFEHGKICSSLNLEHVVSQTVRKSDYCSLGRSVLKRVIVIKTTILLIIQVATWN